MLKLLNNHRLVVFILDVQNNLDCGEKRHQTTKVPSNFAEWLQNGLFGVNYDSLLSQLEPYLIEIALVIGFEDLIRNIVSNVVLLHLSGGGVEVLKCIDDQLVQR